MCEISFHDVRIASILISKREYEGGQSHASRRRPAEAGHYRHPHAAISAISTVRRLLLIRLLQEATISSVLSCHVRSSRPASNSFSGSLLTRRRAASIWRPVAGPTAFDARAAATARRFRCASGGVVNAPSAGTNRR